MATPVPSLLVVRHGQSLWNAVAKWQGLADIDLTDLGRRQAKVAAHALSESPHTFGHVMSSTLKRAAETAAIIATHLELATPSTDSRWREADAGPWQGLTPDEIRAQWPGFLERNRRPEGFEPYEEVLERVLAASAEVLGHIEPSSPTIVVSHSGVIRTLQRHFTGGGDRTPNLGGVWLHLVHDTVRLGHVFDPKAAPPSSGFSEDPGPDGTRRSST